MSGVAGHSFSLEDSMNTGDVVEQLHLLQQEIALAGETLEALRRDHRAEIDAIQLELEVLRRCLQLMHPELQERFAAIRADVVQKTDPEGR
jgi:predicted  nucleic acid-binding Zn-ribbon protein